MQAADWEAAREPSSDPINKKRPRHSWTRQDRLLLCLLYRIYDNTARDYAAVFSYLYKDSLEQEGFSDGLPSTSLSSQFHDMAIGSNGHDLWRNIHIEQSLAECSMRHADVRRQIEDAARELRLELYSRVELAEFTASQCYRLGKPVQVAQHIRGVLSNIMPAVEDTTAEEELSEPAEPLQNQEHRSSNATKATPRLLFRFSNTKSAAKGPFLKDSKGFIAGSFVNNPCIIAPVPTEILGALALIHLTPDQRSSQTPFISFFSSILPPVQRALRSSSKAYVSVIDARIAEEYLRKRFDDGKEVVYSVYKLVSEVGLKLRNNYTGPTEFLVYGAVPSEAIVGIFNINDIVSFQDRDFEDVLQLGLIKRNKYAGGLGSKLKRSAPPLLFATGQVIGRLLNFGHIPAEYIEVLAWKIAVSWRFGGYEAGKKTSKYTDFMNGVHVAYGQGHARSVSLEDQVEEDQDLLDKGDDDADYSSNPDGLEAFGRFGTAEHPMPIPTTAERFPDDEDLLDRQLEADCPELAADHLQTVGEGGLDTSLSQSDDIGEIHPITESLCIRMGSSSDPDYEEPFEVAGESGMAPRIAHVGDWGGSPSRSFTPLRPRSASRIAIVTGPNGFFIDLTGDTEEEDVDDTGNV